jgi:multiple sugar transport system ATP-binding protein
MRDGEIQQVGPPQTLYDNPVNLFVGGFIGEPPMNFFPVEIEETGDGYAVTSEHFSLELPERFVEKLSARDTPLEDAILGIRPEDITDADLLDSTEGHHVFDSRVKIVEPLGSDKFLTMIEPDYDASDDPITSAGTEGEIVTQATEEYTVRVPPESTAREGDILQIAMELDSLHLFDANTGKNVLSDKKIHYKKDVSTE